MTPDELAHRVSSAAGRTYSYVRCLAGGMTGAQLYAADDGSEWVIKAVDEPRAIDLRSNAVGFGERLRIDAGWPVPARSMVEADGWLYVLQPFVPGTTVGTLNDAMVKDLLAAHERRIGLAQPGDADEFAEHLIMTLAVGGNSYCLHQPLRDYSDRTARFVARVEAIGAALVPTDLPALDICHWDLHSGNLIERDGQLVAVIDLDFVKVGDGLIDVATLALNSLAPGHSRSVRNALFGALEPLTDAQQGAFLGHVLLKYLDWAVRLDRKDEVAYWLDHADRLLTV